MKRSYIFILSLVAFSALVGTIGFGLLSPTNSNANTILPTLQDNGRDDDDNGNETAKDEPKLKGQYVVHKVMPIGGIGGLKGEKEGKDLDAQPRLRIFWDKSPAANTPDELIATTLPYSVYVFVLDETKANPTVEFVFDKGGQNKRVCHPNQWLDDDAVRTGKLCQVILRLNRKTLEDGVYDP